MPIYVWTAKDRFGSSIVREITAGTAEESRAVLLGEGCTELALMTDDVMAAASASMPGNISFLRQKIEVSESEKLKFRNKRSATYLSALWEGALQSKKFLAIIVAIGAWQLYCGNKVGVALTVLGLVAWFAFLVTVSLPSIYYKRLVRADEWNRWDEVLTTVETLKTIGKFHFIKVPETELGRFRAKALAGKGHLNEALAEYAQYEDKPGCPKWLYMAFVANIYDTTKEYDKAVEWRLKSIQEKNNPLIYLDLANLYARRKRDAVSARAALGEAEKGIIPDLAKVGHLRYRGTVAYVEGNYPAAKKDLEASLELLAKTPNRPYSDGTRSIAKAYLCCVLAKLGDREGAKKNFKEAQEYLVATDEKELLKECQRAVA